MHRQVSTNRGTNGRVGRHWNYLKSICIPFDRLGNTSEDTRIWSNSKACFVWIILTSNPTRHRYCVGRRNGPYATFGRDTARYICFSSAWGTPLTNETLTRLYRAIVPNRTLLPFVGRTNDGQNVSWFVLDRSKQMWVFAANVLPNMHTKTYKKRKHLSKRRAWYQELFALGVLLSDRVPDGELKDRMQGWPFGCTWSE